MEYSPELSGKVRINTPRSAGASSEVTAKVGIEIESEDEDEGVGFCLSPVVDFCLTKAGFPPFVPASILIFLKASSLTMRRDISPPVTGSIEATPASWSEVR